MLEAGKRGKTEEMRGGWGKVLGWAMRWMGQDFE